MILYLDYEATYDNNNRCCIAEQQNQFESLLVKMVADIQQIPDEVMTALRAWSLPKTIEARSLARGLPDPNIHPDIPVVPVRPPPEMSYGSHTAWQAKKGKKEFERQQKVRDEILASQHILPAIKKGDLILVKTGDSEWWVAKAGERADETERSTGADEKIKVK